MIAFVSKKKEPKEKFLQSFQVLYKTDDFLDNLRDNVLLVSGLCFSLFKIGQKEKCQVKMYLGTWSLMPALPSTRMPLE